jgi:hypothetical protein
MSKRPPCPECVSIARELREALNTAQKTAAAYFSEPVQNTDRSIALHRFTEEFIAELEQAVQSSPLGRAYRKWSAHRALTGHTGV